MLAQAAAGRQHAQAQREPQLAIDAERGLVAPVQQQAGIAIGNDRRVGLVAVQADA